jgi:hypothetical protein
MGLAVGDEDSDSDSTPPGTPSLHHPLFPGSMMPFANPLMSHPSWAALAQMRQQHAAMAAAAVTAQQQHTVLDGGRKRLAGFSVATLLGSDDGKEMMSKHDSSQSPATSEPNSEPQPVCTHPHTHTHTHTPIQNAEKRIN